MDVAKGIKTIQGGLKDLKIGLERLQTTMIIGFSLIGAGMMALFCLLLTKQGPR